jgi:hypothetical protein
LLRDRDPGPNSPTFSTRLRPSLAMYDGDVLPVVPGGQSLLDCAVWRAICTLPLLSSLLQSHRDTGLSRYGRKEQLRLTVKRPKVRKLPESLGVLLHNWLHSFPLLSPRSVDSLSNICQNGSADVSWQFTLFDDVRNQFIFHTVLLLPSASPPKPKNIFVFGGGGYSFREWILPSLDIAVETSYELQPHC